MTIEPGVVTTNDAYQKWIDAGYQQFAQNGLEGIQVEKLARVLKLNKSGFYYYFGHREHYLRQLLKFHLELFETVAIEMRSMTQFDPDFFTTMMKHKLSVMVQMQLLRYRHHESCNAYYVHVNNLVDKEILPEWSRFIGIPHDAKLALQFFGYTRDLIYSRITLENITHEFLKNLIYEVKEVAQSLLMKGHPGHEQGFDLVLQKEPGDS